MTWKLISYSELNMPLPPRKSGYAIGIAENPDKKRLMVRIDKKYFGCLAIGARGKIESIGDEVNSFIPNNFKETNKTKVALVTGSSSGIGKAIALELARQGFDIIINSSSSVIEGKSVAKEIVKMGRKSIYVQADISDPISVDGMISLIIKKFGRINVLINNSGVARDKLLETMTKEDWDKVISVNLTGAFNCTKAAITHMRRQGSGRIINISSIAGEIGTVGKSNYAASKAGIIAFTKSIAKEYAGDGITVNAVAPGLITTKMVEAIPKSIVNEMLKQIPIGRLGVPEDIANLIAFLVSNKADYITGQVINVNGGLYM